MHVLMAIVFMAVAGLAGLNNLNYHADEPEALLNTVRFYGAMLLGTVTYHLGEINRKTKEKE